MTAFIIAAMFIAPLGLAAAVWLLYRRTGHGFGWQILALVGPVLAAIAHVVPSQWLHAKRYVNLELAVVLAMLVPAGLLLLLAVKPWPRAVMPVARSEI